MSLDTTVEKTLVPFDRKGSESIEFYAERAAAYLLSTTTDAIFTTVGVYPNSTGMAACKTNGVVRENLTPHIWYNLTYRPGRALYVNGILVYDGMNVNPPEELLRSIIALKVTTHTKPYQ